MDQSILLQYLQSAPLTLAGQFTYGSNAVFLVNVDCGSDEVEAVYKPSAGEQPLWDFPPESLAKREVAAYLLSEALGWELVPPTVLRTDGPAGPGSLQVRVPHDAERHYFTLSQAQRERLRPAVLFDLLANNADRKGGHVLFDAQDHMWLIDHGLCFHTEPKLRTVIWDFVGEPFPEELVEDLKQLKDEFGFMRERFGEYLAEEEVNALEARLIELLTESHFPAPPEGVRAVPYPLV